MGYAASSKDRLLAPVLELFPPRRHLDGARVEPKRAPVVGDGRDEAVPVGDGGTHRAGAAVPADGVSELDRGQRVLYLFREPAAAAAVAGDVIPGAVGAVHGNGRRVLRCGAHARGSRHRHPRRHLPLRLQLRR